MFCFNLVQDIMDKWRAMGSAVKYDKYIFFTKNDILIRFFKNKFRAELIQF
jgi:hypothetical protein